MRREISLPEFQAQQARVDRQEMLRLGDIPEEFWGPCDWARFDCRTNQVNGARRERKARQLRDVQPGDNASPKCAELGDIVGSTDRITLIYGPVGLGKTKLAVEMALAMAERDWTNLLYLLASKYAKAPWTFEFMGKVLILDDYLRWYDPSSNGGQAVNALIADRYHRDWPTIITSNIKSPRDIPDMAVLDRIGTGLIVEMRGQSKRREHAQGQ